MSDDILSVIPTDPYWQPGRAAGEQAAALVTRLVSDLPDDSDTDLDDIQIDVDWYDTLTVVDCGENLERIGCPHCGAELDREWYANLIEAHPDGFPTLTFTVPCCSTATPLNTLDYDWPCGFARFEIAVWNPERIWFTDEELADLADALGHPVRQIRAHI
ncbi:hypothetical protein [Streptomyces sp. NPDC020298]|uniref:hypothetical protein n=1 Tax=unclassified Streptomyces TaxID=2593676 RepID=UPI0033E2ACAC